MVELDQIKFNLRAYEDKLAEMERGLSVNEKLQRIEELERNMEEPDFWDDAQKSAAKVQELKNLKDSVETIAALKQSKEDIFTLIDMADEENDESMVEEIQAEFEEFENKYESLRMETLLSGEFDHMNAIVRLIAGAGGTESCDWASMLYRMYTRWCA